MTSPCRRNPCASTASCLNNPFLIAVLSMLVDVAGQNGSITSLLIFDLPGCFLAASLTELPFCRTVYARLIKKHPYLCESALSVVALPKSFRRSSP